MMKLFFNTLFFFFILFLSENSAYSLSNYQIKEICQKKTTRSTCIKKLKLRKLNLLQGNKIEIPVIPFNK
ncbi:Conserved hypothetical protein [Prochlorococcus marinus subsp. pastoris str. CCMP1986]|uniref:Uncharacterized protein n=1 Tax=Prochlorococcus marinus subsp. pastoris (strain CCMP1986 / NIES-2087 / MED4) TaxID=59919 RepID=A8WIA7_PROMP|nr:hypothetical protein PROCH_1375 [Prochlorococcus marinus str. EQPAC1]CAP16392.1 Conserved hypothetical protein [Prochlorococcus marinus subsp. pastoris str. CCMP1986]